MKTTIMCWENAEENKKVQDIMNELEIDDVLRFFDGDIPTLVIDGKSVPFVELDINSDKVIIYLDASYQISDNTIVQRLESFYQKYSNNYSQLESTLENMASINNGVLYRHNQGYTFGLHQFN